MYFRSDRFPGYKCSLESPGGRKEAHRARLHESVEVGDDFRAILNRAVGLDGAAIPTFCAEEG